MNNSDFITYSTIFYFTLILLFTFVDFKFSNRVVEIKRFLFSTIGRVGILCILIIAIGFCLTVDGHLIGKILIISVCTFWVYLLLIKPEHIGFRINKIKVSFYSNRIASLHIGSQYPEEACEKVVHQLRANGIEKLILKSNILASSHRHHPRLIKRLNRICNQNQWSMHTSNEVKLGELKKLMLILTILLTHKLSKTSYRTIKSISKTEGVVIIYFKSNV